jgi:multiple sugar transport system permease protein
MSRQSLARREALTAYLFIAPYLIVAGIFTVALMVYAFYVSMTDMKATFARSWNFVWFANYARAFRDTDFLISLGNVFWYFVIVTTCQTVGAILLATLLNTKMRGQRIYRTMFYAPSVASSVVMSMIFWWLFLPTGWINAVLGTNLAWLQDARGLFQVVLGANITSPFLKGPSIAWMAIMFMAIFSTIPTFMVMFLAALQDIPGHLYEAAAIDGSTGVHAFFHITLPLLRPVILLVVVLGTIGTFQVFDQVSLITRGGPLKTTLTPAWLIYAKTLGQETGAEAGFGAAMAFILAAVIFGITIIQRRYIETAGERY